MSNRKKFVSKKSRISELLKQGKSIAEVAKEVGVKPGYVYHIRWTSQNKGQKAGKKKPSRILEAAKGTHEALEFLRGLAAAKPEELQPDPVNHPPHYKAGNIETIDFIEAKDLNYRLGNVVKYVSRCGRKANSDPLVDLKKARWYLDREIFAREGA